MIDTAALWIGYAVMVAGGAGLALVAMWLAIEGCWRMWRSCWNAADILEATAAWRRANPEKFARWKRRNGISDGS